MLATDRIVVTNRALAWISSEGSDGYWCEGDRADLEVERTDDDEIRIGLHLSPGDSEDAGCYLTEADAEKLMTRLGKLLVG